MANVYLYYDGLCSANELIEDNGIMVDSDGNLYANEFIEQEEVYIGVSSVSVIKFVEGEKPEEIMLLDENGNILTDNDGNYLVYTE